MATDVPAETQRRIDLNNAALLLLEQNEDKGPALVDEVGAGRLLGRIIKLGEGYVNYLIPQEALRAENMAMHKWESASAQGMVEKLTYDDKPHYRLPRDIAIDGHLYHNPLIELLEKRSGLSHDSARQLATQFSPINKNGGREM